MRLALLMLWSSLAQADLSVRPGALGEIECEGQHCVIRRALVERVLANVSSLALCARIVPFIGDGKPSGFKLYAIRPRSLFARLLIENGDVIRSINGLSLSTPDRALECYAKLRGAARFAVEVERRGELLTFDYEIRG